MKPTLAHTTALTASYTRLFQCFTQRPTAGTHSHFSHAQAQPHQSTALIRMGKGYHLVAQVASGSPLHSAPLQRSRALATTARRRQALRSVWSTCCGHSCPSHAVRTRPRHRARSAWSWRRVRRMCGRAAGAATAAREAGSGATQSRSSLAVLSTPASETDGLWPAGGRRAARRTPE